MRKLCAAAVALLSAVAFLMVGSPPASAFGSEVLGCSTSTSSAWTANHCSSSAFKPIKTTVTVTFSPANMSGTYGTSWTLNGGGIPVNISSGCTAGSLSCTIRQEVGLDDYVITATLTLSQSGQTRTVAAQATIQAGSCTC